MSARTSDEDRAALIEDVAWLAGTDHPEHIARRAGYASAASLASVLARWGAHDLARRLNPTDPTRTGGTPMTEDTDPWQARAACRQLDPELWHLDEHANADDVEVTEQARAVCAGCPVRDECLAEAMADRRLSGVWGATTTVERERARRLGRDDRAEARRAGEAPAVEPDAHWTHETMRLAHAARVRGEADPWTLEGERRYQAARHLRRAGRRTVPA